MEVPSDEIYFNLMQEPALETMVRHLSGSPRSKNWPQYLRLQDVALLCRLDGGVSKFLQSHFDSVIIMSHESDERLKWAQKMKQPTNTLMLHGKISDEEKGMLRGILLHLAPTLRTLTLGDPVIPGLWNTDLVDLFSNRCIALERICCSENSNFLECIGPKLQVLEIKQNPSQNFLETVADNCVRLREIYLGEFTRETTMFWKSLGNTLEKLSVEFYDHQVEEIEKVQVYCRKLKWLDVSNGFQMMVNEPCEIALQELIISYGEQLEYALLPIVLGYKMKGIVAACPNACFKLSFVCYYHLEILQEIGSQLITEQITIPQGNPTGSFESVAATWAACPNVEFIDLWYFDEFDYIRGVFAHPKHKLKSLIFRTKLGKTYLDELLKLISRETRSLENLTLSCNQIPRLSLFKDFLFQNRSLSSMKFNLGWPAVFIGETLRGYM